MTYNRFGTALSTRHGFSARTALGVLAALVVVGPGAMALAQEAATPWVASSRHARKTNPVPADAASIAVGKSIYAHQCMACHGRKGHGDGKRAAELSPRPRDLGSPQMWTQSDGELFWKTTVGRRPMPSFKKLITETERWQVIDYLRTLAPKPAVLGPRFALSETLRSSIAQVIEPYIQLQQALAAGDTASAADAAGQTSEAATKLASVEAAGLDKAVARLWKSTVSQVQSRAATMSQAISRDPGQAAIAFDKLSRALAGAIRSFGGTEAGPIHLFACGEPTSSSQRRWMQRAAEPVNPYADCVEGKEIRLTATFGPTTVIENKRTGDK